MSRYRLLPTPTQEAGLMEHCRHARYVWNLAVEQHGHGRPGYGSAPGYNEQCRQLTAARAEYAWLRAGSQTVQQQALRDFAQAMTYFFRGTHRRPTWRKAGQHEGFRQVGMRPEHVKRTSRRTGQMWVPKVGWVRFRWSRDVPAEARSYRVTRDRIGRWHVAFSAIPEPIPAPQTGAIVGVDRGVVVSAALSTGDRRTDWVEKTSTDLARHFDWIAVEALNIASMTRSAKGTVGQPGRNVRQKAGLNRGILAQGWGRLITRLGHKAPGRVVEVVAAYSSLECSVCRHTASDNRKSQAVFACTTCGRAEHADVNAAKNIKHRGRTTLAARGALQPLGGAVNREPHPTSPSAAQLG